MGTEHLICVASGGEDRIAQYGKFDGYPEVQGMMVLSFLKSPDVSKLKQNLNNCSWITDDEYSKLWQDLGVNKNEKYVEFEVFNSFYSMHPELDDRSGAKILNIVADSTGEIKLQNDLDFSLNSEICKWAYVIDFDKNTFEVYIGDNLDPLDKTERFYDEEVNNNPFGDEIYPVKLHASFELTDLPSEKEFLEICGSTEEDIEHSFEYFGFDL